MVGGNLCVESVALVLVKPGEEAESAEPPAWGGPAPAPVPQQWRGPPILESFSNTALAPTGGECVLTDVIHVRE